MYIKIQKTIILKTIIKKKEITLIIFSSEIIKRK